MRNRNKPKINNALHAADGVPGAIAQGAEDAASRVAGGVEVAGARVAKGASSVGDRAMELKSQLGGRRSKALAKGGDAVLKAQLAKTSLELAKESTELREAVNSLSGVIKANRKSAVKGRMRLILGIAVGAVLTYHLDGEHGKERRTATARRLTSAVGR